MKPLAVLCCLVPSLVIPARGADLPNRAVPADVRTLVQGNNAFALDLYARLRAKPGNLFYSPYSISTALAMSSAGCIADRLGLDDAKLTDELDPFPFLCDLQIQAGMRSPRNMNVAAPCSTLRPGLRVLGLETHEK